MTSETSWSWSNVAKIPTHRNTYKRTEQREHFKSICTWKIELIWLMSVVALLLLSLSRQSTFPLCKQTTYIKQRLGGRWLADSWWDGAKHGRGRLRDIRGAMWRCHRLERCRVTRSVSRRVATHVRKEISLKTGKKPYYKRGIKAKGWRKTGCAGTEEKWGKFKPLINSSSNISL